MTAQTATLIPRPYVEFDSHEASIQHGGIQHIRDLRDAGRRAIEAATGSRATNVRIQCHGGVHGSVCFSVRSR
jgi:hypothetical protein